MLFDFNPLRSSSLREGVLGAFIHPAFLQQKEGRRLLSYATGQLHSSVTSDAHSIVKAQVLSE